MNCHISNYRFFIAVLIIFNINPSFAQDKRDYQWFFGKDQQSGPGFRALKFDYNDRPITPDLRDMGLSFDQNNVSICDKDGELLFYSNGCAIANREHEIMMNGEGINAGEFFEELWLGDCRNGYPGRQDMLILEDPTYQDGYYIIHKRLDSNSDNSFRPLSISYSYVDMALDEGLGAATEKNVDFYTIDEFLWSYLTAIYHSNGKDWWIINPGADSKFYIFSINDNGLNLHSIQGAEHVFDDNASAGGESKFSPDGTQYAYFNHTDGLLLYDFDRLEGQLSNVKKLHLPITNEPSFTTCEWSPSSEFIYLATSDSLWQVEVAYDDLEDGKVFIAEYNGIKDPFSTQFFTSTLGPDCRIYIRPGSGSASFHVIHKPDKKGVACHLEQQGIKLPTFSSTGSFPNFPRFRVDEEEKCDPSISSIFGELVYFERELKVIPNPASHFITLKLQDDDIGDLYILDMAGQLVFHQQGFCDGTLLDISFLAVGVYTIEFVPLDSKEHVVYTGRLVKVE